MVYTSAVFVSPNYSWGRNMINRVSFVQYLDITPPVEYVDRSWNRVSSKRATDNETECTMNSNTSSSNTIGHEEWNGLVPFSALISVHITSRSTNCIVSVFHKSPAQPTAYQLTGAFRKDNIYVKGIFWPLETSKR